MLPKISKFQGRITKEIQSELARRNIEQEDRPVLDFLKKLTADKKLKVLDVGSGLGHFAQLISSGKNVDVSCLEINKSLASRLKKLGLKVLNLSILNVQTVKDRFDIVHCAHVLEHFGYPEVTEVLDNLFFLTKPSGYLIIRGPLMHPGFYNDIDHVRPYPPTAILQYYSNFQQQKKGNFKVSLLFCWDRREEFRLSRLTTVDTFWKWAIDLFIKSMWLWIGWPTEKPNGYVAIFQRIE